MSKFKLIAELTESKLFRREHDMTKYSYRDILDFTYLYLISFEMLKGNGDFVKKYANKTLVDPTFKRFKSGTTDMQTFLHIIFGSPTSRDILQDGANTEKLIKKTSPTLYDYVVYLNRLRYERNPNDEIAKFIFKEELSLAISNSKYKTYRRAIRDWNSEPTAHKKATLRSLLLEIQKRMPQCDIKAELQAYYKSLNDTEFETETDHSFDNGGITEVVTIDDMEPSEAYVDQFNDADTTPILQFDDITVVDVTDGPFTKFIIKQGPSIIGLIRYETIRDKIIQIKMFKVTKMMRGKGIGFEVYKELLKAGYDIVSDIEQTRASQNVWSKLARIANVHELMGNNITNRIPAENMDEFYSDRNAHKLYATMKHLNDGSMLDESAETWDKTPYKVHTELLPVSFLNKFPGNNLRLGHGGQVNIGYNADIKDWEFSDNLEDLGNSMKTRGVQEPLIIIVGQQNQKAYIGEGNHRLAAANQAGIKELPVRIMVRKVAQANNDGDSMLDVSSILKIPTEGYTPSDAKPSNVFELPFKIQEGLYVDHGFEPFDLEREDMPQIKPNKMDEFLEYLEDNGVAFEADISLDAEDLKPTQKEFNPDKIHVYENDESPILVSQEGYVLDGHHRWMSAWTNSKDKQVNAIQVYLSIEKLMDIATEFDGAQFHDLEETHAPKESKYMTALNETFDSSYEWEWATQEPGLWIARMKDFDTPNLTVIFDAVSENSNNYEVGFKVGVTTKRTNAGDEFKIFSTVIKVIESFFIDNPSVESINFTAYKEYPYNDTDSRASLYKRMINRFAKQHNLEFASGGPEGYTDFILRKKQVNEDGRIVKGVNTTQDVDVGEIKRQAKKFGFDVDEDGYPANKTI